MDGVERLTSHGAIELVVVGDSVAHQLFVSLHYLALELNKRLQGQPSLSVRFHTLQMIPESESEMNAWMETDLLSARRPGGPSSTMILLVSLGLWYNLKCSSMLRCFFNDPTPSIREMLERQLPIPEEDSSSWLSPEKNATRRSSWVANSELTYGRGPGYIEVGHIYGNRKSHFMTAAVSPEQVYAQDMLRLFRALERRRHQLSDHMFWIGTVPQHYYELGTFVFENHNSPIWNREEVQIWRANLIAKSKAHAPAQHGGSRCLVMDKNLDNAFAPCLMPRNSTLFSWRAEVSRKVHTLFSDANPGSAVKAILAVGPLLERPLDHGGSRQKSGSDCTHYCSGSEGWNEYVRTVLTAVIAHGKPAREKHKAKIGLT